MAFPAVAFCAQWLGIGSEDGGNNKRNTGWKRNLDYSQQQQ